MEKIRNKKAGFFIKLFSVVAIIAAILFGVYIAIDKLIVPTYFKTYGINNMHELVSMVKTLYSTPNERELITNGFNTADQNAAVQILTDAGFPTTASGEIDYSTIANGIDKQSLNPGNYQLTDKQIAGIIDQMLDSGVLGDNISSVKYIDALDITVLELKITPEAVVGVPNTFKDDSAHISFTFKFGTESIINQMADAMDTPLFLLNMIMPKTLYITLNFDLGIDNQSEWVFENGNIAVNGRTAKESEILLNLLINFIFTEDDHMTTSKFTEGCGQILTQAMDMLGEIRFKANISSNQNGIVLNIE